MKIKLKEIASGFNLAEINSNFVKIQNALNNQALYRNNPSGEPNTMNQLLDMDGHDIINIRKLGVQTSVEINGLDLATEVAKAQQAAQDAINSGIVAKQAAQDAKAASAVSVQTTLDTKAAQAAAEAAAASVDPPTIVRKTSDTGSAKLPSGDTAQRDSVPQEGYTRFNTTLKQLETYNGTAWVPAGQGATGAVGNPVFYENDMAVTGNYTLTTGKNAMSAGPITINNGVVVTIPNGQVWSVV